MNFLYSKADMEQIASDSQIVKTAKLVQTLRERIAALEAENAALKKDAEPFCYMSEAYEVGLFLEPPQAGSDWADMFPVYRYPPFEQRRQLPEGCMWAVTKGGRTICQPPRRQDSPAVERCAVPAVWQLVPKEPTEEMIEAGNSWSDCYATYEAMLAASPKWSGK